MEAEDKMDALVQASRQLDEAFVELRRMAREEDDGEAGSILTSELGHEETSPRRYPAPSIRARCNWRDS